MFINYDKAMFISLLTLPVKIAYYESRLNFFFKVLHISVANSQGPCLHNAINTCVVNRWGWYSCQLLLNWALVSEWWLGGNQLLFVAQQVFQQWRILPAMKYGPAMKYSPPYGSLNQWRITCMYSGLKTDLWITIIVVIPVNFVYALYINCFCMYSSS